MAGGETPSSREERSVLSSSPSLSRSLFLTPGCVLPQKAQKWIQAFSILSAEWLLFRAGGEREETSCLLGCARWSLKTKQNKREIDWRINNHRCEDSSLFTRAHRRIKRCWKASWSKCPERLDRCLATHTWRVPWESGPVPGVPYDLFFKINADSCDNRVNSVSIS